MNVGAEQSEAQGAGHARWPGILLLAGGFISLSAAGLLLWSERGVAVFNDTVIAALAWCF